MNSTQQARDGSVREEAQQQLRQCGGQCHQACLSSRDLSVLGYCVFGYHVRSVWECGARGDLVYAWSLVGLLVFIVVAASLHRYTHDGETAYDTQTTSRSLSPSIFPLPLISRSHATLMEEIDQA